MIQGTMKNGWNENRASKLTIRNMSRQSILRPSIGLARLGLGWLGSFPFGLKCSTSEKSSRKEVMLDLVHKCHYLQFGFLRCHDWDSSVRSWGALARWSAFRVSGTWATTSRGPSSGWSGLRLWRSLSSFLGSVSRIRYKVMIINQKLFQIWIKFTPKQT